MGTMFDATCMDCNKSETIFAGGGFKSHTLICTKCSKIVRMQNSQPRPSNKEIEDWLDIPAFVRKGISTLGLSLSDFWGRTPLYLDKTEYDKPFFQIDYHVLDSWNWSYKNNACSCGGTLSARISKYYKCSCGSNNVHITPKGLWD